jgi:hypothetical protein
MDPTDMRAHTWRALRRSCRQLAHGQHALRLAPLVPMRGGTPAKHGGDRKGRKKLIGCGVRRGSGLGVVRVWLNGFAPVEDG